jgi:hypothetical protein
MFILVKFSQKANAWDAIEVTDEGMVTLVRPQKANTESPIDVIDEGNVTLTKLLQP